jgi:hypothetical protein
MDDQLKTLFRQLQRNGPANSPAATGDQNRVSQTLRH